MGDREFDIIIYGATGFTGQFVVEELTTCVSSDVLNKSDNFKWAIAGRNKQKLQKVLQDVKKNIGIAVDHIPIVEANSDDYDSILSMCKRARIVISVIGPFRFYGEPVFKACVEAATNYVDISGESQFLEGMQLKYHEQAKQKEICLVGASGWDSIPSDLGVSWTKKQFKGDLAGCEIIAAISNAGGTVRFNYGTWRSFVHGIGHPEELPPIREKLFKEVLPMPPNVSVHKLPKRSTISYIEEAKGYCMPFIGPDRSAVKRSQVYLYNVKQERPISSEVYIRIGDKSIRGYLSCMALIAAIGLFSLIARFESCRRLLEGYPGFFSLGLASKQGSERSDLKKLSSTHTIIGYGWNEKYDDVSRQHTDPPQKKIVTRVTGPDPGYFGTSRFLVQAAITLLKDKASLPGFGVLTPGAAFVNTDLVNRLSKRDIKFEVVREE